MRLSAWVVGLAALFMASAALAANVGFETVSIPVAGDRPLQAGIWYPTEASEAMTPLALGRQSVALDAPILAHNRPLVVISHGTGGSLADHFDTARALVQAGFVVAAISHTGDTYDDRSRALRITERPAELVRLIDYMTAEWRGRQALDAHRIGAFGFSSGGFTVLGAIGGEPNTALLAPHCAQHPYFFDCQLNRQFGAFPRPAAPKPVAHDPRIRAAVVAAPALGFTFAPSGLAKVAIPVQLWRAEWDTVLPQPYYAEVVHGLLPKADYRLAPRADHFDFLPPCSEGLARAAPSICVSNIDRAAFHAGFNREVVRFFQEKLR
jgi:predicted dienelactone hydrolase